MTEKLLAAIFVFIKSVIATTGYSGIAILMAIESACIPLPSELIMPFAGYLVYEGTMNLCWAATAGAIGCNLGSLVAYEIGCYGGRPLVERYGRWILMGRRELDWADRFFARWGLGGGVHRATAAGDSDVYCVAGGDCAHAAGEVSRLHVSGIVAVVLRSGVFRNEAGGELAVAGEVLPSVRYRDWGGAGGGGGVVRVVALAEPDESGVTRTGIGAPRQILAALESMRGLRDDAFLKVVGGYDDAAIVSEMMVNES